MQMGEIAIIGIAICTRVPKSLIKETRYIMPHTTWAPFELKTYYCYIV